MIKATLKDHMGSDLSVVNAARVSFGKEAQALDWEWYDYEDGSASGDFIAVLDGKDQKLIQYLAKHKHLSPFGHAFASFHVKAPIFVARQLVKHKFLRWNEISRRYVDDEPEFYSPVVWRGKSEDKKQGSSGYVDIDSYTRNQYRGAEGATLAAYHALLKEGVAPEMARMVLPQSTLTEFWWSGSLDAWASMCKLRCAEDTQYESRIVANQISKIMGDLFPVSWNALMQDWGFVPSDGRRATKDDVPPWEYSDHEDYANG
jgi:thymidylate synthase (FAD)